MTDVLTLDVSLRIAESARLAAIAQGAKVAMVVVDRSATRLLMHRMDGAYLSAEAIASKKAFTAANFRVGTDAMAQRLNSLEYQALVSAADERLTFLKGGLPLSVGETFVGAIGVSGGTGDQDLACCQAAVDRLLSEIG